MNKFWFGAVAYLLGLWLSTTAVIAAPMVPAAITVSPASVTAQLGSRQTSTSVSVGARNNFDVPVTIRASFNGFDIRNHALVPSNRTDHELDDVISFTEADTEIPPHSAKNITVLLHDSPKLSPGGHYVSLLLTQIVNDETKASQLGLTSAISATIYIIKEDGAVRSLKATKLHVNRSLFSLPKTADVSFYNDGNVTTIPRGVVTISRRGNSHAYAQGIINQESIPLYPKTTTPLQVPLTKLRAAIIPGRYSLDVQYRADGFNKVASQHVEIWYIPKSLLGVIGLMVAGGAGFLFVKKRLYYFSNVQKLILIRAAAAHVASDKKKRKK